MSIKKNYGYFLYLYVKKIMEKKYKIIFNEGIKNNP